MPEFVTLYTFQSTEGSRPLITVMRSTLDPTYITFNSNTGSGPSQPPVDTIVGIICQPGTFDRYTYKVQVAAPYAYYSVEHNSTFCGYVPPACDIREISFEVTDETNPGANDGTVNLFCTSSFAPITYFMSPPLPDPPQTNTTGYFTGLKPGTSYYINATDTNECNIHHDFVIRAFSDDYTHYKYRLQFPSANGEIEWELQLYDMRHAYLKTEYPKDVIGGDDPVVYKIADPQEDKFTPIVCKQLDITLLFTGNDFTVEEFATAPEQTWYVQLMKDDEVEFKGYLLPDEMQDMYADAPYMVLLKATDGLPSLKGNLWGDGSGGKGYGTYQIQQYGLTKWCLLLKQCLDQLRYDYGDVHIVSSLRYNNLFTSSLWFIISTWSDILYDSSGVPVSTYDALSLLMQPMKLTIVQDKGEFKLINWNDLTYINNGVVSSTYAQCFYRIFHDFSGIVNNDPDVPYGLIGFDTPMKPLNPPQTFNFDKPYNIENDCSFNILALLYENPSFEIGAVQGELPPGWVNHSGVCPAYCNYDPLTPDVGSGALDGNWELKIEGYDATMDNYIETEPGFSVDQANQLLNISFGWKPASTAGDQIDGHDVGMVFSFGIIFIDGGSGNVYCLMNNPNVNLSETDYLGGHTGAFNPDKPIWAPLSLVYNTEGDMAGIKGSPTTDFIGWQNFQITCPPFPETQRGQILIRFYPPVYQQYDSANWNIINPGAKQNIFEPTGIRHDKYVLIDQLNITLSDASNQYNLQTGEKHITTVVTGLPTADVKQNDLKLFTYPPNKRVAGNIFYGTDYLTAVVANTWNFALKSLDKLDRLPATITKAYARQYQRPMYKFDGEILAPYLSYYAVYGLRYYEGKLFQAFSIESHLRLNKHTVTLIEICDDESQTTYQYVPEYERNARNQ